MSRVLLGLATGLLAASSAGSAIAADWGTPEPMFRPAYPVDMAPMEDGLDFEAGLRYFYGMGSQSFAGSPYSANDVSHALEVHGRIDDHSTSTYVKGHIGYGAITDGSYEADGLPDEDYNTGRVGYINADFGYYPLATETMSAGAFLGYMYEDESPQNTGLFVHGLRLGVTGNAEINDVFDINAEAAIIPYANATGAMENPGGSRDNVNGSLYGAAAEILAGFHVTDNFVVRAGARGTYLNGYVSSDQDDEEYVELFRWGPLVELTATF